MQRQLGQYLLEKGAISTDQLHVALEAQTRFGGRLGFNLVDLGYLSPIDLARHLGAYHGVDPVEPTEVRGVRWDILNSIPRDLLLKHRAIPVAMTKGRITIVMSDPSNLAAVDEMSFATGKAIHVRVAPDFIIKRALETYFGASFVELVRPQHAIEIEKLRHHALGGASTDLQGMQGDGERLITPIPGLDTRPSVRPNHEDDAWLRGPAPAKPIDGEPVRTPVHGVKLGVEDDLGPVVVGEVLDEPHLAHRAITPIHDLREACFELARARHWSEVVAVLLGFSATIFERAALFRVAHTRLRGWRAVGSALEERDFRGTRVPVTSGLVKEALAARGLVMRELRVDPTGIVLTRALGAASPPRAVCVARLDVRGQPVGLFYADDATRGTGSTISATLGQRLQGGRRSDLEILLRKSEVAFEMVSVRRWLPRT